MIYLRGNIPYKSWEEFWKYGHTSKYFKAEYDETSERMDSSLSERQLFTQSNGRTLLGQDTVGRLHFVCTPHNKIYSVPSGGNDLGGQFKGHIGQYYQNDAALFLGKVKYELEMNNGLFLEGTNENSKTEYRDYFLPVTETVYPEMELKIFSMAPVMEKEAVPQSSIHPLPGPAGVYYSIEVKNTAGCTLEGKLRLSFEQNFVPQFEHYGKRFEDYTVKPYKAEWDHKLLILWHPEACGAIQLIGAVCEGEANNPRIYVPFSLKKGERRVFTTVIAVAPKREEIYANLGILYQHTALEWLNITTMFWKERLGEICTHIREQKEFGEKYTDMQIRFLLDNFNCLSFDEEGNLLTNWQGAPSHSLSRLWGIDIEPDVVSVMYVVPEVGPRAVEYLLKRNTPRYSLYGNHSIFFLIAPLLIAGKYLELTGDKEYFIDNPEIVRGLEGVFLEMLKYKHKDKALFSSRYASDLIVFRKYDYGANVKCFYALQCYLRVKEILGEDVLKARKLLECMPEDMAETMEGDGPFGKQITGGTDLGESSEERFYIPGDLYYYGGEDTATVLAPLYHLYEFDYEPYVNLHRFAKSMFITNYDPEFQTMRELHFGMNPSATGCTLKLGGSFTRKEMMEALELMYSRLDETGSLFWWPRAYNKKRCLTRCSQGQGAWIQQSIEQWYGLRIDGVNHVLTIRPQGLLTSFQLEKIRLGSFSFTIQYKEERRYTEFSVTNHNREEFELVLMARPYGAGAEGNLRTEVLRVLPGETVKYDFVGEDFIPRNVSVVEKECRAFGSNDLIFSPYGIVMPKLYTGRCGIFLLRFVVEHIGEKMLKNVEIQLTVPNGWKAVAKKFYYWNYQPVFNASNAVAVIEELPAGRHGVAGFYVSLPEELWGGEYSVMLSQHPFPQNDHEKIKHVKLYLEGETQEKLTAVKAVLRVEGKEIQRCFLPVEVLTSPQYAEKFDIMYHGEV